MLCAVVGVMFTALRFGITVTVGVPLSPPDEQPCASVTDVKVYVVEEPGVTGILLPDV